MNRISRILSAAVVTATMLPACTPPAGQESAKETAAKDVSTPAPDPAATPSVDALLALERQAMEAYIRGDGAFFEGLLSDKLVMQTGGKRLSKADVVNMINGVHCDVREGWALEEPQLSRIDDDTFALTYKATIDGSCTAGGETSPLPSPVRAASVWARSGQKWMAVFHGEIPIVDPAAPPATEQKDSPNVDSRVAQDAAAARPPVKPTSDANSDALMAAERAIWDAWMKHDAERINALVAGEVAFVNLFGTYFPDKATTVADWTSTLCQVDSFMLGNAAGTAISPSVGILTLTGTVRGNCGGTDISGQKIHATTVYVREGDEWKWAFGFNSPN